jgi:threonine dehydrogenase-like Zn-dependent dehydrogenase
MFVEKGRAALIEEPLPTCAADTVLLRTRYSGLTNGTERNVLLGGNYGGSWPSRCGYQCVSQVIEIGAQITRFAVGDLVYTGTFSGHVAFHTARERDLIIKLPEDVNPQEAALLGVASVGMHDIRRADIGLEDSVLVIGAGLVGQFAAQAARVAGARVTVADLDETRLALAEELGADTVIALGTEEGQARLQAEGPYSAVVECSGADVLGLILGESWSQGIIGHRARVLIIAGRGEVTYSFNAGQGAEAAILHAGHFEQSDLEHVLRHVRKGAIRIRPLIKDVVPISDAIRVYDLLRDGPNRLLGTVFVWD